MHNNLRIRYRIILLGLVLLAAMMGSTASAITYDLCAGQAAVTMPDGQPVTIWGLALDTGGACTPSLPGPVLRVSSYDPGLTINLRNTLTEPVSLHILGQQLANNAGPVWDTGAAGARPDSADPVLRVRSFTHEADPNGGTATYIWNPFKPGTYLVQSGTNPAKQVQMGISAVAIKDAAAMVAYADNPDIPGDQSVPYDEEMVMVFQEIDPAIHAAVAAGTYGPGGTITSSVYREPRYFLINGKSHPDPELDPVNGAQPIDVGERLLIRFVNAGAETHMPELLGEYMTLVAEDGNLLRYSRELYTFELNAAKTTDAIYTSSMPGKLPLIDGRLKLNNAGAFPGGMLAFIQTGGTGTDTVTITKANYVPDTLKLKIQAYSSDPTVTLTAEAIYQGFALALGTIPTDSTQAVFRLDAEPEVVRVTSSGGGSAVAYLGGAGSDTVTITKSTYDPVTTKLKIQAYSNYPPGSVDLLAEALYGDFALSLGPVPANSDQEVFRLKAQPTAVRVTSSGGGTATADVQPPTADTVTITKAAYTAGTNKLKIQAYTSWPYEAVTLTAYGETDGQPDILLGTVPSNSDQEVFRLPSAPQRVRIESTGGGTNTVPVL